MLLILEPLQVIHPLSALPQRSFIEERNSDLTCPTFSPGMWPIYRLGKTSISNDVAFRSNCGLYVLRSRKVFNNDSLRRLKSVKSDRQIAYAHKRGHLHMLSRFYPSMPTGMRGSPRQGAARMIRLLGTKNEGCRTRQNYFQIPSPAQGTESDHSS